MPHADGLKDAARAPCMAHHPAHCRRPHSHGPPVRPAVLAGPPRSLSAPQQGESRRRAPSTPSSTARPPNSPHHAGLHVHRQQAGVQRLPGGPAAAAARQRAAGARATGRAGACKHPCIGRQMHGSTPRPAAWWRAGGRCRPLLLLLAARPFAAASLCPCLPPSASPLPRLPCR